MQILNQISKSKKDKYTKEEIVQLLNEYDFIDVPKRIMLSKLFEIVKTKLNFDRIIVKLERERDFVTVKGESFKCINILYKYKDLKLEKVVVTLEAKDSKMYTIRYVTSSNELKELFLYWYAETKVIDDMKGDLENEKIHFDKTLKN